MHTKIKYVDFIRKHDFAWLKFGESGPLCMHQLYRIIGGLWILVNSKNLHAYVRKNGH